MQLAMRRALSTSATIMCRCGAPVDGVTRVAVHIAAEGNWVFIKVGFSFHLAAFLSRPGVPHNSHDKQLDQGQEAAMLCSHLKHCVGATGMDVPACCCRHSTAHCVDVG